MYLSFPRLSAKNEQLGINSSWHLISDQSFKVMQGNNQTLKAPIATHLLKC